MALLIIIVLGLYALISTIYFLTKVDEQEDIICEQKRYIRAYNEWYQPYALDEDRMKESKKLYEIRIKEATKDYERDMKSYKRK